jgi:hypothetical protein
MRLTDSARSRISSFADRDGGEVSAGDARHARFENLQPAAEPAGNAEGYSRRHQNRTGADEQRGERVIPPGAAPVAARIQHDQRLSRRPPVRLDPRHEKLLGAETHNRQRVQRRQFGLRRHGDRWQLNARRERGGRGRALFVRPGDEVGARKPAHLVQYGIGVRHRGVRQRVNDRAELPPGMFFSFAGRLQRGDAGQRRQRKADDGKKRKQNLVANGSSHGTRRRSQARNSPVERNPG